MTTGGLGERGLIEILLDRLTTMDKQRILDILLECANASVFIKRWPLGHPEQTNCPLCKQDLLRVALVELLYVFEVCLCGKPAYPHLVEQLWHRVCFLKERP